MGEKLRIYVGGLGSNVREDDLKKTFGSPQLGCVESVEIIRSKGRSFGYMDFVPASDKSLAKLFSAYNGCMWKGGKLKLEKAREHYLFRLGREWTEDAELETKLANQNVDADESKPTTLQKPKENLDIANMQIRIFFPKLRKIKPLPVKGTGKHKYSFQRVDIPPLPINFCDCEEHSIPQDSTKRTCNNTQEMETFGVNEEELNIMKSVLNKLLEKDNLPNTDSNEAEFTEEPNHFATSVDNMQVANDEEEQVSDDDNLVINIVAHPNNRVALTNDWGQKSTASNQDSFLGKPESFSGKHSREMNGSEKRKLILEKKRKRSIRGNDESDNMPSKRKRTQQDLMDVALALDTRPTSTESGSTQKSAWRSLVNEKKSTAFHISDPEIGMKPVFNPILAPCSNEKDTQNDQSKKDEELEKNSEVQSNKPIAVEDKTARGAARLKKSSLLKSAWLNKSSFSISQILPGVAFEKQETH